MSHQPDQIPGGQPGHEPLAISVRAVVLTTIGLVALVVVTLVAIGPLTRVLTPREAAEEVDSLSQLPREAPQTTVGLNPNQARDRLQLVEQQQKWLGEYAWLNDSEQVARIPIDRAMQIVRERGLDGARASGASSPEAASEPPGRQAGE